MYEDVAEGIGATTETASQAPVGSFLNKNDLAAFGAERKTEKVVVNAKGDYVFVTELIGSDRDWYEKQLFRMHNGEFIRDGDGVRAKMIVLGLTDENGRPMFGRNEWSKINVWNTNLQGLLFDKICDLSGISEKSKKDFLADSETIDSGD